MSKSLRIIFVACIFSVPLRAQHGTAPNGYYPSTYHGSIFTGSLESVSPNPQEITLAYTKGSKSDRFAGRLESMCGWQDRDGTTHSFKASDIPRGTILTAFYIPTKKETGGEKKTENSVFAISYVEVNGKKISEDKRVIIPCSEQKFTFFRVFQ